MLTVFKIATIQLLASVCFSQENPETFNSQSINTITTNQDISEKELLKFVKENNKEIDFVIEKAESFKTSRSIEYAEICFRIAEVLTDENKLYQAYEYLDRASTILEKKDVSKIHFASEFYKTKGTYFYNFRRYEESKALLLKGLGLDVEESSLKITMLNTLGLIYNRIHSSDSSLYYFNKALNLATKLNNNDWVGVINGNLGYYYYLNDDIEKARDYLVLDKELSLKNSQTESAVHAISMLIELDLKEGNLEMVDSNMAILDSLFPIVTNYSTIKQYYYTKTIYWESLEEYEKAYVAYRQGVMYNDSSVLEYDETNLQNMIFQIEFQKKRNESDLILEKEKRTGQFYYGIAALLSIITLACIFIIYQMRKRKKSEHKILELEKDKIQSELKQNELELKRILKNLVEKNEIIDALNREIDKTEKSNEDAQLQKEQKVIFEKINSFTLLTESDLLEFKRLFDKIHPNFYNSLTDKYEDLTKSEVRLGMLIRLNLTSLEMSLILGISQDSVRKANLRLRKKLEIDSQKELVQVIKMI
ncbi:transcriptional regulator [Brumimicrobium mesophilum]|uniref:transcriptional regulator n=1 Tax=Brumimicrobium mesophilum TaxID=392717 RepID=UPI000D140253|nr:tetratricopeptide repeat protein [Brumimicrobium mesophilum]